MSLRASQRRILIAVATIAAIVAGGLLVRSVALPRTTASDPAVFDAGALISDYNFFNPDALTTGEVQSFLEDRTCRRSDDSPCLWEYRESTVSEPAQGPGHCAAYRGATNERASTIIAKVARACTISPKVLLVLLQKEQSLLTRPSASGYLRATGYGCPDTADCDTDYFGFFNQVYRAAWQFRQYTQEPERAYKIGAVSIAYNPDSDCGAATVRIRNQATANLYNYTPYQPDAAALAGIGGEGEGGGCSTHGNLNFWLFYNTWFGSSLSEPYPSVFASCLNLVGGQPCARAELIPTI